MLSADEALQFINKYKDIAVREMHRTGIPASVTLAQAIHESSWGKGVLALNSNNHFGIKCKADWTGETYYKEDDDYVNGKLVKSCFRHYPSVDASYVDHSDFLKDNARYSSLFQLGSKDYMNWAKGLKSCGYATDPEYANKLIRTIEEYQLYEYDFIEIEEPVLVSNELTPSPGTEEIIEESPATFQEEYYYEETNSIDVPAAYKIPENYVRNSYYKKSQPLKRPAAIRVEQTAIEEPAAAQTFDEQYSAPAYSQSEELKEEEEVYGEKAGNKQEASPMNYSSVNHHQVHMPIKHTGIRTAHHQTKPVRNSVIKNRRLPRVRVKHSRK